MAEWIGGVTCIHSLACGIMMSLLLSLAIQATVSFSSSTCDQSGENLETGNTKCVYTNDRKWALGLFYGGAVVFLIGSLATCQSSGYIMIIHFIALVGWVVTFVGYSIYRMSSDDLAVDQSFGAVTGEVIRDKWELWADIVRWALGISFVTAGISGLVCVVYFCQYKSLGH